jgi:hypothetical protein
MHNKGGPGPSTKWLKGQSGNPKGRPRRGDTLAEAVRQAVDPGEVASFLAAVMRDPTAPLVQRLAAAGQLADRGWGRPLTTSEVSVFREAEAPPPIEADFSRLTSDELDSYIALADKLAASDNEDPFGEPELALACLPGQIGE